MTVHARIPVTGATGFIGVARAPAHDHPALGAAEEVHDLGGVAGLFQGIRIQKAVGHERAG
jgi:hypothetical protein